MANVDFSVGTKKNDADRVIAQLNAKVVKLEENLKKVTSESRRSGEAGSKGMQSIGQSAGASITQIGQMAMSYLSVASAIQVVTAALNEKKAAQDRVSQKQLSQADAQAAVIKNIGDVSDDEAKKFIANAEKIAAKSKFATSAPILQAASSILSATGGDQQRTLDILEASAPLFRDKPEDLAAFGGATGDVMKTTGETDARKAIAMMLAIQGQARFEDLAGFKNVAPALAAAGITGGGKGAEEETKQAAAAFAAIGSRTGDVEGSITKGAVAALATRLETVAPEGGTMFERLDIVRGDKDKQAELLKSGFQGSTIPVIRELISDSESKTSKMLQDSYGKIESSLPAYERKVRQLQTLTPQMQHASAMAEVKQVGEASDLANPVAAEYSRVREVLDIARSDVDWGANTTLARTVMGAGHAWDTGMQTAGSEEGAATEFGVKAIGELRGLAKMSLGGEKEERLIATLDKMAALLQRQLDEQLAAKNQMSAAGANAQASLHKE